MSGFQKVIVCGNLGKDPEMRSVGRDGDRLASFSIATSESWRDKGTGERKEKTEWHRISVWGQAAEIVEKYVRKGDPLLVEGRLETRKWTDQNNQERYSTEIVVRSYSGSVTLLGSRRDGASNGRSGRLDDRGRDDAGDAYERPANGSGGHQTPRSRNDDLDDEIPFVSSDLSVDPAFVKHRTVL